MPTMKQWIYNGKLITELTDMPEGTWGIVYMITTKAGKKYVGRKQVSSVRKRKFGKKEAALVRAQDKRKKLYEMVTKESDWKAYTGSNKDLNEDIKNGAEYTKEILHFCRDKKQLAYLETKELFVREVLEKGDEYYNSNIQGRFYRKDV